jgi:hypothetical protein
MNVLDTNPVLKAKNNTFICVGMKYSNDVQTVAIE